MRLLTLFMIYDFFHFRDEEKQGLVDYPKSHTLLLLSCVAYHVASYVHIS